MTRAPISCMRKTLRLCRRIFRAHVNIAGKAKDRSGSRRGNAMLARAGFGDQALFAHAEREQGLADGVVDFVGAGVVEVFALEVNFAPPNFRSGVWRNKAGWGGRRNREGNIRDRGRRTGRILPWYIRLEVAAARQRGSLGTKTPPYRPKWPVASGSVGAADDMESMVRGRGGMWEVEDWAAKSRVVDNKSGWLSDSNASIGWRFLPR